jgi:hypothetical protein
MFSARPGSYLYPPLAGPVAERLDPHLRSVVSKSGGAERDVFPGSWLLAASVAGAAVGIVSAARRRPAPGIWLGVAIAGAGFVFSLGPRWSGRPGGLPLPFFALAHAAGGLTRVPARLAMAVPIGLALMAAGALTVIPSTIRRVVAAASLILVLVEVAPSAVPMVLVPTISGAHRRLAARPGVILDLPMAELDANGALIPLTVPREAIQMYLSTANFRPLINGYGAFQPPSYWSLALALQDFPTSTALQALRSRDVRTVVAQTDLLPGTRWAHVVEQLKAWPGVREIDRGTNVVVYDISDAR